MKIDTHVLRTLTVHCIACFAFGGVLKPFGGVLKPSALNAEENVSSSCYAVP
jgi:hypothetical protein